MSAGVGVIGEGLLEIGFGPDVSPRELRRGYGGDAANIAVMAARIGAPTRLLTRVGDDAAGRALAQFWRSVGIVGDWIGRDPGVPTGLYANELQADGNHHFDYHRLGSAAERLGEEDLEGAFLDDLGVLVLTGLTLSLSAGACRLARRAAAEARGRGIAVGVVANCRPARSRVFSPVNEMLAEADIALLSEEDAMHLFGTDSPEETVRALGREERETVVTLGGRGAVIIDAEGIRCVEPLPIDPVVDRAGAGDALAGAYLALRARGVEPSDALPIAIASASLSCRAAGCALSYPTRAEVERALDRTIGIPG